MTDQMEIGHGPPPDETGTAMATTDLTGVDQLVRIALDRGADIEALERLVALRERVEEREARKAFFEALASFQDECPPIIKADDGLKNKHGTVVSKYAKLPRIIAIAGPILRKHGFSWKWDSDMDNQTQRVSCTLTHELGHAETSTFAAPVHKISSLTSGAQDSAGAHTYARRYSFVQVTGIVTADVDNDGYQPPETLDEAAALDMQALAEEVGADIPRFLEWLQVSSFGEIPKAREAEALQALERKRGAK